MINICIIATIVIYLVGMLLVGFAYSKSNEDSSDFYLGGRTMGPLVTAMSAEASDMSSWLLMGMPGLAYLTGIASPGWTAIGLAVGTWLNWLIVARRLRRYSANLDAITVPSPRPGRQSSWPRWLPKAALPSAEAPWSCSRSVSAVLSMGSSIRAADPSCARTAARRCGFSARRGSRRQGRRRTRRR